ncbi:hypothetical protein NL676_013431 [Syzygium grande]|nr:hypothetical protein NL676_013431 [Syzygium grande]
MEPKSSVLLFHVERSSAAIFRVISNRIVTIKQCLVKVLLSPLKLAALSIGAQTISKAPLSPTVSGAEVQIRIQAEQ